MAKVIDLEKERERESLDANAITVSQQRCDTAHELTSVNRKEQLINVPVSNFDQRPLGE